MKKSTIWLLTIVMAITFGALLYFQIMYLENMVKMREEQFSENVTRSLYMTAGFLERQETLHYLEEDANIIESNLYDEYNDSTDITTPYDGQPHLLAYNNAGDSLRATFAFPSPTQRISSRYKSLQDAIRTQYLYQKGLLNEVILMIMNDAGSRPVFERADSTMVKRVLASELAHNGLKVPFVFAVTDTKGAILYATDGYDVEKTGDTYTQMLFQNSDTGYLLKVDFPTKSDYIFSSVRFIIPTLAFTVILLIIFVLTVMLAFRQKKLTELKTDFINNMTHELKTPISTISLAGQMLSDTSVLKSPATLRHLSDVINDESKRLRFQVDKVLQLSVFDDNTRSALKFGIVDANNIISNVVNTFKIKVEKYGGSLTCDLDATDAYVNVDEMQFTNVIFNLLDNAVKYMRPDTEPQLSISTRDTADTNLEIRVRDNGIGIKRDDLKRIFDKFYRVPTGNRHDVKGFGLGLAYVKKMVTAFGGTIGVESELNVGTTFIINLPLRRDYAPGTFDKRNK